MNSTTVVEFIAERYPDIMLCDGFDDALIGIMHRYGSEPVALYDRRKMIAKLMEDGLDRDDAEEFFECNILGACVGELTPAFADLPTAIPSPVVSAKETIRKIDEILEGL